MPVISFHADCAPLFFYDPVRRAVAVCHAGWKGTTQHIVRNAVDSMQALGCRTKNILAAVGPCIRVKNYEVGPEVAEVFRREFGEETVQWRNGSEYADLEEACALDMLESGIEAQHITVSGLCTFEYPDLFFSHRRDNGKTGAMAAVIELISI
jgi:YfiH family protein